MTWRQKRAVKVTLIIGGGLVAGLAIAATAGAVLAPVAAGAAAAGGGAVMAPKMLGQWTTQDGTVISRTNVGTCFSDASGTRGPYPFS